LKTPPLQITHFALAATAYHAVQRAPHLDDLSCEFINPRSRPNIAPIKDHIFNHFFHLFHALQLTAFIAVGPVVFNRSTPESIA
jgi:hypothetical protein